LHPDDVSRVWELFRSAAAGMPAAATRIEYRIRRKDGYYVWFQTETTRLLDADGKFAEFLVISRDITARKQVEEIRRESEKRLRDFAQAFPDASMILDEDGCHVEVFGHNIKLLARPKEELIGLTLHQIYHAADADFLLGEVRRTIQTGIPQQYIHQLSIGGAERMTEGRMAPMDYLANGKKTVAVVITDISAKRQADKIMRQAFMLRRRTEFINDVIRGEGLDARNMAAANAFGIDLTLPLFCCLIHIERENGNRPHNDATSANILLQSDIIDLLSVDPQLFVWDSRGDIGVGCMPRSKSDGPDAVAARLMKTVKAYDRDLKVTLGVSDILSGLDGIRKSYRQAASAVVVARSSGAPGTGICHFRQIGIYQFLAHFSGEELSREFVAGRIGKLIEYDSRKNTCLLATLEEILRSASLKEAAQRLYLHYNTAIFRKRRIEKILGVSIDDFEDRLALSAAIKLHRLDL
ncbi:MAG TPA: PAS domain S-box protein, partial [Negativicutes bacterium]|nr:PAS domain S-box protein [Negativicutes bacterium]